MKKTLSKLLAIVLAVILILSACPIAFAADDDIASGTAGEGINWVIDAAGTLTISGEDEIVVGWYAPPWEDYNDSILNVVVKEGITTIPDTAFCHAENAVTVSIPASVTDMNIGGTTIFWNCTALREINVDTANETFASVDGIVFTKDMTTLCFYPANKSGETYTIPDTVTTINFDAFAYNQTLQTVVIPDTVTTLDEDAFCASNIKSITIGSGIKTIPLGCFASCNIESIVIPDSVETIEYAAFWNCSNLKTVTIGTGVKTIGSDVFYYCSALTAIHYTGTEETWAEIEIDEENEVLNSLPVHYMTEADYQEGFAAPDCTTNGHTDGLYCETCAVHVTGSVLYAPGHDFADGVCQAADCGYVCVHNHEDLDGICDVCGKDVGFPEIKLGETKVANIESTDADYFVKFSPTESGEYILSSDNSNSAIGIYATAYDSEMNGINSHSGSNFKLIFDAEAGETYYFKLGAYTTGAEYTYTLERHIEITHQPTSAEPYVALNWNIDTQYQWYKAEREEQEITDKYADAVTNDLGTATYDSENGWSGVYLSRTSTNYFFFTVPLRAGDTVTVELTGDYKYIVGLYDFDTDEDNWLDIVEGSDTYELTVEKDGNYTLYTISDSGNVTAKAYGPVYTYADGAIDGETNRTLSRPVIGESYICEITVDGKKFASRLLNYTYAITHQPTAVEPYVELNDYTYATYQWYVLEETEVEVTDENAGALMVGNQDASYYDSEKGWTPSYDANYGMGYFFAFDLEKDDSVKIAVNGNAQYVLLVDYNTNEFVYDIPDSDGTVTLTAPATAMYYICVYCDADTTIKAYTDGYTDVALEYETAASLENSVVGKKYVCKVTFADESTETSDILDVDGWQINVEKTGVYDLRPGASYTGDFSTDDISVYDRQGNEVLYYEKLGGYPLVSGKNYIVKFNDGYSEETDGALQWNLIKKADTIFPDTSVGEWYNDAVTYSVGRGLINGYGATGMFGTADNIQRQDFVVILARLAGVDLSAYDDVEVPFNDVADDQYYTNAILWAAETGITTGYTDGSGNFGVGDVITREQLVTFLYRYARYANGGVAPDVSEDAVTNAAAYADFAGVTDYAREAVIWALDNGVIKGQGGTRIDPSGNALRCEIAQIMYNIFLNDTF